MRQGIATALSSVVVFLLFCPQLAARPPGRKPPPTDPQIGIDSRTSDRPHADRAGFFVSAALDTYVLAEFDFDTPGAPEQGWQTVDATAQPGPFFHVDDFSGLGGGSSGGLRPFTGLKSLWCGTRHHPEFPECTGCYPGYDDSWDQRFESRAFPSSGDVIVSFQIRYDSEEGYDVTTLEYYDGFGYWVPLLTFDGTGELLVTKIIPEEDLPGYVRIRFRFASDSRWSDGDCIYPTDGAAIIDELTIRDDTGLLDSQNFELETVGATATADGDWAAEVLPAFGIYAALYPGMDVLQENYCVFNTSMLWGFFDDPAITPYVCHIPDPKFDQGATPYGNPDGLYLHNQMWSPKLSRTVDKDGAPIPATASSTVLEFDIYRDIPLDALTFYAWHVRSFVDGCPSDWRDRNFVYYGGQRDWFRARFQIADLISPDADSIQVALACRDMCAVWCGTIGGECHTMGPLIDNVRIIRVDPGGPVWTVNDAHLFQDNFSTDGTTTGTARVDMAADVLPFDAPGIRPGDSTVVNVSESNFGLGFHTPGVPASGPAVYCHVRSVGTKSGAAISGDPLRWPVVATESEWTVLRFDSAFAANGTPVSNRYCVDLNDNLYAPPDTIYFYFSARDAAGNTTYWSRGIGATGDQTVVMTAPMEMTCLPANALNGTTNILYVDAFDELGAQPFFDAAFEILGREPDRFDIRAPSSLIHNGLGSRVRSIPGQITSSYEIIIWNSGNLWNGGIGDGTIDGSFNESNDFGVMFELLDQSTGNAGVYISGDDIANRWTQLPGASAAMLRSTYMSFNVPNESHVSVGQPISPLIVGQLGSFFEHSGSRDTLIAQGTCPGIRQFDVLQATGTATLVAAYSGAPLAGAAIAQQTVNPAGGTARVVLSGFSYDMIRDDRPKLVPDQVDHLLDILAWFGHGIPTQAEPPLLLANTLGQNYPNPFNPTTTIRYSIKEQSPVTLRIYNVDGQLVRSLVAETQLPNAVGYAVVWDGTNQAGQDVASGVYFYRLTAKDFVATKKLVVLR